MAEFVFTMHNVRKSLGDKLILDNVTMSFFPDAKIGVVGPNGAGKSTLLKLMAGLEKPNNGDLMLQKAALHGYMNRLRLTDEAATVDLHQLVEAAAVVSAEPTLTLMRQKPAQLFLLRVRQLRVTQRQHLAIGKSLNRQIRHRSIYPINEQVLQAPLRAGRNLTGTACQSIGKLQDNRFAHRDPPSSPALLPNCTAYRTEAPISKEN